MDSVFRDSRVVRRDLLDVLEFYYPTAIDTRFGGYVSQISDRDGVVYDPRPKHLVATCRFVFDFSIGALVDGPDWCRTAAEHGLSFLDHGFLGADGREGYPWLLDGRDVVDAKRSAYGHAFALLAYATAARAGIGDAADRIAPTADLLEARFWEDSPGAYRSDLDADWEPIESYRGQNANMHACEALLAAYDATDDARYLDRAATVADTVARRLADDADGLLWEHFTPDWNVDWAYNRDRPDDLFRPWGYQPGHLLEWAKLLVALDEREAPTGGDEREGAAGWYLDRAERFFDAAVEHGWDDDTGGFVYTFDRDRDPIVEDRYFWPLAEGLAAAAHLGQATGDARYWDWYDRVWGYVEGTLTNHRYGIWYEAVTPDGEPTNLDPSPKVKSGYHHVNACYEVLRALDAD